MYRHKSAFLLKFQPINKQALSLDSFPHEPKELNKRWSVKTRTTAKEDKFFLWKIMGEWRA